MEVGTDSMSGERGGKPCRQVDAAEAGEAGKCVFPRELMAPAVLSSSPQDLGASVLPSSSRFEALGLSSSYVAVGLLKNSAVLGSFCRITTDVAKHSL